MAISIETRIVVLRSTSIRSMIRLRQPPEYSTLEGY